MLFLKHDVELYNFSFAHAPRDFLQMVPSDRCLVDEDILVCVVTIDETMFVLNVKPFNSTAHSLIY